MLKLLIAFASWSPGLGLEREVEVEFAFAAPEMRKHHNASFVNLYTFYFLAGCMAKSKATG